MLKQGRSMPVNFLKVYELLESKLKKALVLQMKIQGVFRTGKTRGTNGALLSQADYDPEQSVSLLA